MQPATTKATVLLAQAQAAGPAASNGADYDLAMATNLRGEVLSAAGQAALALNLFFEAQHLCDALGSRGEHLAAVVLTQQANALVALGRLDDAVAAYAEAIKRDEKLADFCARAEALASDNQLHHK